MTLKSKLYASYGAMATLALAMGLGAIIFLTGLAATTQNLGVTLATKMYLASSVRANAIGLLSLERGIVLRTMGHDLPERKDTLRSMPLPKQLQKRTCLILAISR